jgi:uncharacterized alkaline shock family protein YloU
MDENAPASLDQADPGQASPDEVWHGKTTIAPDVLLTIARLSALAVEGVAGTSAVAGGVNRLFQRGLDDGVRIDVKDQAVSADLFLVLEHGHNVRQVGRAIQAAVTRAIQEMTGMDVLAVNVYVEDIAYPEQA